MGIGQAPVVCLAKQRRGQPAAGRRGRGERLEQRIEHRHRVVDQVGEEPRDGG